MSTISPKVRQPLTSLANNPRISVRAIVIQNGMILLSKYQDERGFWYVVPGGGVNRGETLEEAFYRETIEECGHALSFGEILFIREIIADHHENTMLTPGFHQIEINVKSHVPPGLPLAPIEPDHGQIDLVWHPLNKLTDILFFPMGLVEDFMNQSWSRFYYGDVR